MSKKLVGISFKRLQLKSLVETTGNPQKTTDAEFKGLVKSIKKDGWLLDAAVCWKRPDGKHQIISGHHRVKAAIEAGLIDADVKVIEGIDEKQARLLVLEANQRKGAFDTKAFDDFVNSLSVDFDIDMDAIFDKIGVIDEEQPKGVEDDYEIPDEIDTDIKLGDVFEIGRHRLLCGDSTDIKQVGRLMNGEMADLLITDPPYGIDWSGDDNHLPNHKKFNKIKNDDGNFDLSFIFKLQVEHLVIFGANCFPNILPFRGRWICWDKRCSENADRMLGSPFELAWTNKTSGFDKMIRIQHGGAINDDFENKHGERFHPTQKPIRLFYNIIDDYKAMNIVDIFIGSGSTMMACHQSNRKCYGMEIEPRYCQVIIDRMFKFDSTIKIKKNGKPYKSTKNRRK